MKRHTWFIWYALACFAIFTRLYGLGWGLPFLFHPDERNMSLAASSLSFSTLLDPYFYAYNQFSLYIVFFLNLITGVPLTVLRATILLRSLSAVASIGSVYLWFRLLKKERVNSSIRIIGVLIFICTPVFIQLSHFGTTESILIFFFLLCLVYIRNPVIVGIAIGLSIATKVSAVQLFALPVIYMILNVYKKKISLLNTVHYLLYVVFISFIFSIAFSPHIILSYQKTLSALHYESAVGMGTLLVFYTQEFIGTYGALFQIVSIFPYALGLPLTILSAIGLVYALFKKPLYAAYFVILFFPNAFIFAKWTRFMIYPYILLELLAIYAIQKMYTVRSFKLLLGLLVFYQLLIGLSYLKIYSFPDVRVQATQWINRHIPSGSTILTEGANVTDLPLYSSNQYRITSLFLYDIENDTAVQSQLSQAIQTSDYIVLPSRRVFANTTCLLQKKKTLWKDCSILQEKNTILTTYYTDLFAEKKFKLVATFTAYPRIEFAGKTIFSIPDEHAEETWTVFDHPVVRIYKKR
ncbi:hypothetical protein COU88_00100 [Candidatus Roizmanbacteria bacterium CG10_big_fil_rev_8_21_14_0_10_39_6]|uniref:Glycosyltransferase RgtA/B/C/D-like domain-containing protein n=1 Tax=Candidatus Roizmanbacteria bacterium CG10_big_fil_rev_8_21_14_0_10_39_6 TaxID=1974853 RepID=A0A2M8KTU6_9BACT|nr:MAG: hypothetical protein COU88_00100 [Candidatus Roizmanbacteria bacterium CG10_big_fil_rev_8_21_14_0_10_39_6]